MQELILGVEIELTELRELGVEVVGYFGFSCRTNRTERRLATCLMTALLYLNMFVSLCCY